MTEAINPFDLLAVMAQISVAFAGFGSIATGLGNRREEDTRVDAGRLVNMLIVSLSTVMLSLLPCTADLLPVPQKTVWGICALIAAATVAALTPGVVERTRGISGYSGYDRRMMAIYLALDLIALAAFVMCALQPLPAFYLAGLIALQLICAILFYRVTASLLRPHPRD